MRAPYNVFLFILVVPSIVISQYQQQQQRYPNGQYQQQNSPFANRRTQQNPTLNNGMPRPRVGVPVYGPGQQMQQNGYNNMNRNRQFQNGMAQPQAPNGRSVVVNTPTKLQTSNFAANGTQGTSTDGAQVEVRLTSYQNADLSLSNATTCACPSGSCVYLSSTQQNSCYFGFLVVISSEGQSVQYIQSDFYPFAGQLSAGNWTNQYSFPMPSKPIAIDVLVHHMGVVIDKLTSQLLFFNHLTLVDTFVVDMLKITPNQNGPSSLNLYGQMLNTQLQMTVAVQCINDVVGPKCDLTCPTTTSDNTNTVICVDKNTGTYSSCKWNTYKTQVSDCVTCTNGVTNSTCTGSTIVHEQTGVSAAFRTWTIVLGCLLGIAVLFILCLIIAYIIIRNNADEEDPGFSNKKPYTVNGTSQAQQKPLLENNDWPMRPALKRDNDRSSQDSYAPIIRTGPTATSTRQEHQV